MCALKSVCVRVCVCIMCQLARTFLLNWLNVCLLLCVCVCVRARVYHAPTRTHILTQLVKCLFISNVMGTLCQ
jgi:hypothetical protein